MDERPERFFKFPGFRVPRLNRAHDVENIWCWCDPIVMKLCPLCHGAENGCGYCLHFPPYYHGMVVADDPGTEDPVIVIHRYSPESVLL